MKEELNCKLFYSFQTTISLRMDKSVVQSKVKVYKK